MKRYALSNAIGGQLSVSLLRAKDISNSFQHYCVIIIDEKGYVAFIDEFYPTEYISQSS